MKAKPTLVMFVGLAGFFCGSGAQVQLTITHGVSSGDVTPTSVIIWARGAEIPNSALAVEYSTGEDFGDAQRAEPVALLAERDFTGRVVLTGLKPATRYYYRARQVSGAAQSTPVAGTFVTAPEPNASAEVRFVWSADLGGQGQCRRPEYFIFNPLAAAQPDFFLFSAIQSIMTSAAPARPTSPAAILSLIPSTSIAPSRNINSRTSLTRKPAPPQVFM